MLVLLTCQEFFFGSLSLLDEGRGFLAYTPSSPDIMGGKLHMPEIIDALKLTKSERSLIINLLEEEIPGLREEIRHTDDWHYREDLKEKKKTSLNLLAKLRHDYTV
jgi:hypothetical protein